MIWKQSFRCLVEKWNDDLNVLFLREITQLNKSKIYVNRKQ
jgi:hypothetical protein